MVKSPIHQNIKYLVEEKSLGQQEFGDLFGLSQAVISNYKLGKATPKLDTIIDIASHFELDLNVFIMGDLRQNIVSEPYLSYKNENGKAQIEALKKTINELENRIELKDQHIELLEVMRSKNEEIIQLLKSQLSRETPPSKAQA